MAGPRHDNDHALISDIKILPTTGEILSLFHPVLPAKDGARTAEQLLNAYFRHLRFDNVESIIDACNDGVKRASWSEGPPTHGYETPRGFRYSLFREARFESIRFHQFDGIMFDISFDCPYSLCGLQLLKSGCLEKQKMCSLIAVHPTGGSREINIIHFEIKERQITDTTGKEGYSRTRAQVQVCMADKDDILNARQAVAYAKGLVEAAQYFLVDLPNVLSASFMPVLQQLQRFSKDGDFPFAKYVIPGTSAVPPPHYASISGFRWNFSSLQKNSNDTSMENLKFQPMTDNTPNAKDIESLKKNTTLDDGQAVALYENLSRCLAFTQGPPGTGKTFLGVAEAEVILSSRVQGQLVNPKPLVVVCATNHALDDFVLSLVARGMDKVVRLGNRSTNTEVSRYHLQKLRGRKKMSPQDWQINKKFRRSNDKLTNLGQEWAAELSSEPSFRMLQDFLRVHEPGILQEFERLDAGSDITDLRFLSTSSVGFTFKYWLDGGDLTRISSLLHSGISLNEAVVALSLASEDVLSDTSSEAGGLPSAVSPPSKLEIPNMIPGLPTLQKALDDLSHPNMHQIWRLNLDERKNLYASWLSKLDPQAQCDAFIDIHRRHQELSSERWRWIRDLDARLVQELGIQIVALTATGAARNWDFLNSLRPETYIVEEASELTEPITVSGLVPSLQHLIMIGDPLQLRPHVSSHALCTENNPRYRLDESLFERLMTIVPYSKLNMQRRAHPDMANILRAGNYPFVVDNPTTIKHPDIPGLAHRMYWVDHTMNEDHPDPSSPFSKSFSNKFEVRFISEAVKYLVQRQHISMKRITILAAYNGQVAAITKALQTFCKVLLNYEDKQNLVDQGLLSDRDLADQKGPNGTIQVTLDSLIRVTSVDNYQGEENDIVFFSAVRSNHSGKVGFLANQNRINVAVSRARDAFYVVGNATLLQTHGKGWREVIDVFKQHDRIGTSLPIKPCSEHEVASDIVIDINNPQNFKKVPKCTSPCGAILDCGHACKEVCHAEEMHTDGRLKCEARCNKILECGHKCTKLCYEECGPCSAPLSEIVLDCGHKGQMKCSTKTVPTCSRIMKVYPGSCGHIRFILCGTGLSLCKEPCKRPHPCGHKCPGICDGCPHTECSLTCGEELPCGHLCTSICHFGSDCPPCKQTCLKRCEHGHCRKTCSELCSPCIKPGPAVQCPHTDPAILCCLPGSRLPCAEPCNLQAPCGLHRCQGLCGEECPEICDLCDDVSTRSDMITLPCSHVFPASYLDQQFEMSKLYEMDGLKISKINITDWPDKERLHCPTCKTSIRGSGRYAFCHEIHIRDNIIGGLCADIGRNLSRTMTFINNQILGSIPNLNRQIRSGPLHIQNNQRIVAQALASIKEAQKEANRYQAAVIEPVQDAITKYVSIQQLKNSSNMQPKLQFKLRSNRVITRCEFTVAKYLLDVYFEMKGRKDVDSHLQLFLDVIKAEIISQLNKSLSRVEEATAECQNLGLARLEVEFIIQKSQIIVVLRKLGQETIDLTSDLNKALNLCRTNDAAGVLSGHIQQAYTFVKTGVVSTSLDDALGMGPASNGQLLWKRLAKYDGGKLAMCSTGHYYCTTYFDKCPECG